MNGREWAQLVAGISVVIVAIGGAIRLAAPGIAGAGGVYTNVVRSGTTGAPLLIPISTVVVNVFVVAGSLKIVQMIAETARTNVLTSLVATLSVLQGSFVSVLRELWGQSMPELGKIAFEAAIILIFATAAFTWRNQGKLSKLLAAGLFVLPPVYIAIHAARVARAKTGSVAFAAIDGETIIVLVCLLALAAAAIIAHYALPESLKHR